MDDLDLDGTAALGVILGGTYMVCLGCNPLMALIFGAITIRSVCMS